MTTKDELPMVQICVHLPEPIMREIDGYIEQGIYHNRSELVRAAVMDYVVHKLRPLRVTAHVEGRSEGRRRMVRVRLPLRALDKISTYVRKGHRSAMLVRAIKGYLDQGIYPSKVDPSERMEVVDLLLPAEVAAKLDELVKKGVYSSVGEAIRAMVVAYVDEMFGDDLTVLRGR